MHHVVIIVMIAMLTLCYSIMSHATLIIYYHASIHVNTTNPLDITRTLAATCVILGRLECVGFEPIISKPQPVYL